MKVEEYAENDWSIPTSTTLPFFLHRRVRHLAQKNGITVSECIRDILSDFFGYEAFRFYGGKIGIKRVADNEDTRLFKHEKQVQIESTQSIESQ